MTTKTLTMPLSERVPAELLLRHSTPAQSWQLTSLPPILRVGSMSPYRPTRREFLIGAAGLLVLAPYGCGGESGQGEGTTAREMRTVEHARGTTQVPVSPTRMATPDTVAAINLLLLGLTQLAAPDNIADFMSPISEFLPDEVSSEDIETVGEEYEPDLETLVATDPQMILTYDYYEDSFYEKLTAIAPTVINEWGTTGEWRPRFDRDAAAVGRTERAKEVVAGYEETLDSLDDFTETTVSCVRIEPGGTFRIDGTGSFPGSVLTDAGIEVTEAPEGVGEDSGLGYVENISGERLDLVTGDAILVEDRTALGKDKPDLDAFRRNPLWETLPAVQAGRVIEVPGAVYNGGNYASAQALIESIASALG